MFIKVHLLEARCVGCSSSLSGVDCSGGAAFSCRVFDRQILVVLLAVLWHDL